MEMKIQKEAYLKRLNELERKASEASSEEEQKKIAGQIRYVERKLYKLNLPAERKDYKVKVKFVFEGTVDMYSLSKKDALEEVQKHFGALLGKVQATSPEIINWDIPTHPQKFVK